MTSLDLILEECETDEERQSAIYLEAADIAADKAILAFNTFDKMDELNQRAGDVKASRNDSSFDSMVAFYEEQADSQAKVSEKKQNLLKKAWTAVKNFFKALVDKITGTKKEKEEFDPNAEVEISKEALTFPQKVDKALDQVKAFLGSHKKSILVAALAALAALTAISFKTGTLQKVKASVVTKSRETTDKLIAKISGLVNKASESDPAMIKDDENPQHIKDNPSAKDRAVKMDSYAQMNNLASNMKGVGNKMQELRAVQTHSIRSAKTRSIQENVANNGTPRSSVGAPKLRGKELTKSIQNNHNTYEALHRGNPVHPGEAGWNNSLNINYADNIDESAEDTELDLDSETFNEEWEAEIDAILADI
jgi:hypothetical protein